MKQINCPICGDQFTVKPNKPSQQYCSRECWRKSRLRQVTIICETCGKPFDVYQARSHARFCSRECFSAKIELICEVCKTPFYVKRSSADKRRTCSKKCHFTLRELEGRHQPHLGKPQTDETKRKVSDGLKRYYNGAPQKHWNYKNGPFAQTRGIYNEWQDQRSLARQRDNFSCQKCGISESDLGKQLSVHHVKPFRFFSSATEANQLHNLICLCQSCHMKMEHGK